MRSVWLTTQQNPVKEILQISSTVSSTDKFQEVKKPVGRLKEP